MTMIGSILDSLDAARHRVLMQEVPSSFTLDVWAWRLQQAVDAIAWYVVTLRCSVADMQTLKTCRLAPLVRTVAMTEDLSVDALITTFNHYLERAKRKRRDNNGS